MPDVEAQGAESEAQAEAVRLAKALASAPAEVKEALAKLVGEPEDD